MPALAHELLEARDVDEVALGRILKVVLPVQVHRPGNVTVLVEIGVLVYLGDDDIRVTVMLGHPLCRDQHLLGVAVSLHARLLASGALSLGGAPNAGLTTR